MCTDQTTQVVISRDFISIVAHDLRNPIHLIKMSAEILREDIWGGTPVEKLEMRANNILRVSDSMSRLVNSLLDACESGDDKIPIKKKKIDFTQLIKEVVQDFCFLYGKRGVEIKLYEKSVDDFIECDPDRIRQVLGNLLENAIKYRAGNAGISIFVEQKARSILVSVANAVENLEKTMCPLIFEKGFVFNAKTSGSRGLGLFISKMIIEAHGGKMWAGMRRGCFRIRFEIPR